MTRWLFNNFISGRTTVGRPSRRGVGRDPFVAPGPGAAACEPALVYLGGAALLSLAALIFGRKNHG